MQYYVNVHSAFNQMRNEALKKKEVGPSILVTGTNYSGKSTLCRILVNYSLRLGWRPILCDIDLYNNEISPPGCISAAAIDDTLPNDDLVQNSLCFFHGSISPDKTLEFFDKQVYELSNAVRTLQENDLKLFNQEHMIEVVPSTATIGEEVSQANIDDIEIQKFVAPAYPEMFASGTIINGFTPSSDRSTESLAEAIRQFKVDVVLVVDYEMLANQLKELLKNQNVMVIEIPKSGGVQAVKYDEKAMQERNIDAFAGTGQTSNQIYENITLYERYQEYFRGSHY